jgi:hypothetical protein
MTLVTFQFISGNFGSFGPVYEDVTRAGDTSQRGVYIGIRGEQVRVLGVRHFVRKSDASAFVSLVESCQGKSVVLRDTLNSVNHSVFLLRVNANPIRRVGGASWNWSVKIDLDLRREA